MERGDEPRLACASDAVRKRVSDIFPEYEDLKRFTLILNSAKVHRRSHALVTSAQTHLVSQRHRSYFLHIFSLVRDILLDERCRLTQLGRPGLPAALEHFLRAVETFLKGASSKTVELTTIGQAFRSSR